MEYPKPLQDIVDEYKERGKNKMKNKNLNQVRQVIAKKKKEENLSPTAKIEKTFGKNEELNKKQQGSWGRKDV